MEREAAHTPQLLLHVDSVEPTECEAAKLH